MLYYMIALLIIAADQLTKWLVVKNMELGQSIPIIDQVFYITSHRNTGAAWGILAGQMWFFYLITTAVIIGIVYYIQRYTKGQRLLALPSDLCLAVLSATLLIGLSDRKLWILSMLLLSITITRYLTSRTLHYVSA